MSNESAVKRFTYDWLIRFAELHPFSPYDTNLFEFPIGFVQSWHLSKFAAISPLFTTVIARYMPYIVYEPYMVCINNGIIENYTLPKLKKCCIFISDKVRFANLKPGIITLLRNNHVFFNARSLFALNLGGCGENSITSDELKYLLKFGNFEKLVQITTALTEPMKLSEIWPYFANWNDICLDIENLVWDENLVAVLQKSHNFPKDFECSKVNVSDKTILEFFDYILRRQPASLGKAIINKYVSSGVPFGYCEGGNKTSFKTAQFVETDGKLEYYFI
uniref:FBA_2 domain-containing protein n=1 Tax=Panagrellus redivivus TaxID=6233 RepID=A0A7E4VYU5_PANRE